jgi:hypothetical protein
MLVPKQTNKLDLSLGKTYLDNNMPVEPVDGDI